MKHRAYRDEADVARLQEFAAMQIRDHGRVGMVHPGDIPHRMFNGLRREDPHKLIHIWEDGSGEIVAWTLLDPRGSGLDVQVALRLRAEAPDFEREVVAWSETALLDILQERGSEATYLEIDAFEDDVLKVSLLRRLGWEAQDIEEIMLTRRSLREVPEPELPQGYKIRSVRGVDEAGAIADVHSAGFGSAWTPELYRRVMESPGYAPDRELLVEAPDGSLAGFCVTWPDEINRVGYFEPVAVHPDHRRLRLGSALMRAGMAMMVGWGMQWAEVMYEVDNPGSGKLYRGEGFEPLWRVVLYRKARTP